MKSIKSMTMIAVLGHCLGALSALAVVSDQDAARLGGPELTPMGAERAGNSAGSIPEWTGGLTAPPANYVAGAKLADPYGDDKLLFTITADNVDQYADMLSPGQVALFKRYPETFKVPVYPTHRSAAIPQSEYDKIKQYAPKAEMIEGGNGLVNAEYTSTPFPIPSTGLEIIWNHITRYRAPQSMHRVYTQIPVQANGNFSPVVLDEKATWANRLDNNPNPNRLIMFLQKIMAPARMEGDILLVHENIDQIKEPRAAWIYNAGQRRVRRAPEVSYDGPGTGSDGLRTNDDLDLYNGAPDRYNWKLVGKKEMYIPYNSYKVRDGKLSYKDIIKPGHMNPDLLRYELHRVWVVEATLKDGARHIYARRTFYVDEDSWQISVVDHYDGRGELWRVKEGHFLMHYGHQIPWLAVEALHDLNSGRYLTIGLDNEIEGYQYNFEYEGKMSDYTPAALRRAARR